MADGHTIRDHVFDRTLAQLRTLALPPLRRTHARHPALHRRSTLSGSLRFLMTTATNPASGLAPGMPSHSCVQPPCQCWLCAVSRAPGSFDLRQLIREATNFHHPRCRSRLSDAPARSPSIFKIHNPRQDHRVRGKRLRLPSYLQIESASHLHLNTSYPARGASDLG